MIGDYTSNSLLSLINVLPAEESPSCLHTTLASLLSQPLSHTVPHLLLRQSSMRPSRAVVPWTTLTSPSGQPSGVNTQHTYHLIDHDTLVLCIIIPKRQLTPASRACVQLVVSLNLEEQLNSVASVPVHSTLSNHIVPVPSPNAAPLSASKTTYI